MRTVYFIKGGMQKVQQNAQYGIETVILHGSPEWAQHEAIIGFASSESFTDTTWAENLERLVEMAGEWAKGHGEFSYTVEQNKEELNQ